jgi:hypothetical protein
VESKNGMIHRVKYWEIIADTLAKPVGVRAASQPLILKGEHSGLLTHTATTEGALLCTRTKS